MSEISPLRATLRHGSGLKSLNGTWGEALAEFLGTFVLMVHGVHEEVRPAPRSPVCAAGRGQSRGR